MTIKRNSKLIRWAYLFNEDVPTYTSLCPLFWRVVLITPLKVIVISAVVAAVLFAVFIFLRGAVVRWDITFPVLGVLLFISYVIHTWRLSHPKIEGETQQPSLVKEYVKSVKNKVCPMVEIQSDPS